jgi:hypothetical protein
MYIQCDKTVENALIFLHIPKAAGTTLHKILERQYKQSEIFEIDGSKVLASIKEFTNLSLEQRSKIKLLKGHMPFGLHEHLPRPSVYITVLRHPIDRVISHYYYTLQTPYHYLHERVKSQKMTLRDYVESEISGELDNGQVRLLAGVDMEIPFGKCSRKLLEQAKNNLENHFAFVGLAEYFNETILLMKKVLGWKRYPVYQTMNPTKAKPHISQIPEDTLRAIEKRNELDIELYELVAKDFRVQMNLIPEIDLKKFKVMNSMYQGYSTSKGKIVLILRKCKRVMNGMRLISFF